MKIKSFLVFVHHKFNSIYSPVHKYLKSSVQFSSLQTILVPYTKRRRIIQNLCIQIDGPQPHVVAGSYGKTHDPKITPNSLFKFPRKVPILSHSSPFLPLSLSLSHSQNTHTESSNPDHYRRFVLYKWPLRRRSPLFALVINLLLLPIPIRRLYVVTHLYPLLTYLPPHIINH